MLRQLGTLRRADSFRRYVSRLKPTPANDRADGEDRMADARTAFAKSGVDAVVIDNPDGFKGHGAAGDLAFARKFGGCIESFIDKGAKQQPC